MPGDFLDISSDPDPKRPPDSAAPEPRIAAAGAGARRFVGIHFACCDVYARIYINRQETAYAGNCPRCTRKIELKIGPGGTDSRFFTVY